jgi:hypothetical protein
MLRKLLVLASVLGIGLSSAAFASNDSESYGDCIKPVPTDFHCNNDR